MLLGISLNAGPQNMLAIFLHVIGLMFTAWFILDTWRYVQMWYLWAFFGLLPFLNEILIIRGAASLSKNVSRNLNMDEKLRA
mmetsp:Transcript_44906/g.32856  ORF Transcript_44906/g.32856 Transcript_44906/m.32856 type:complete len:82 (+) Transcript_44906:218-463(+)